MPCNEMQLFSIILLLTFCGFVFPGEQGSTERVASRGGIGQGAERRRELLMHNVHEQKLVQSSRAIEDRFGRSLAIDGKFLASGAFLDAVNGNADAGTSVLLTYIV